MLDPAFYGALTITKSITIMGVEGASAGRNAADNGITINAGPDDTVSLSYLTVDGFKTAKNGILLNSAGSLRITNCKVQNFTINGILIQPSSGTTALLIADTAVTNNGAAGISLFPKVTGVVKGAVERVLLNRNGGSGLETNRNTNDTRVNVTVADSVATNNSVGYSAASQGILRLVRSVASDNVTGVFVNTTAESAGNNTIRGNGTNIAGFMSNAGTQ
ncbi:MAG TPA: right-handed parallel beta-helix repeat-containing protein [Methylocella sp.]|nr:right-handed parallel beta-helix repeat-containing protein [Methylocella sp.]